MCAAQFMTGDALLVSPILHWNVEQAPAYFPPGRWYSLYDYAPVDGGTYGLNSTVYVRTMMYCCSKVMSSKRLHILPGVPNRQAPEHACNFLGQAPDLLACKMQGY